MGEERGKERKDDTISNERKEKDGKKVKRRKLS